MERSDNAYANPLLEGEVMFQAKVAAFPSPGIGTAVSAGKAALMGAASLGGKLKRKIEEAKAIPAAVGVSLKAKYRQMAPGAGAMAGAATGAMTAPWGRKTEGAVLGGLGGGLAGYGTKRFLGAGAVGGGAAGIGAGYLAGKTLGYAKKRGKEREQKEKRRAKKARFKALAPAAHYF